MRRSSKWIPKDHQQQGIVYDKCSEMDHTIPFACAGLTCPGNICQICSVCHGRKTRIERAIGMAKLAAGQHLLVLACIYDMFLFWCLAFLFLAVEASAAKRSEAALNCIVFQVWEQMWQSRMRLLLITCWKV